MEETFLISYLKRAKETRLSLEKKAAIRQELEHAMFVLPLPEVTGFSLSGWFGVHRMAFASSFAIALVFVSGTGVSLAAERALPGDRLYSVKTGVNERVRETFSLTDAAKIAWELRRVERRVDEADELSSQGRLSGDTRSMIEEDATLYASRAEELASDEERERVEERIRAALGSATKVRASFENRRVMISEREEGEHDEEHEPYDDEESDERERDEARKDEEEHEQRENVYMKPSEGTASTVREREEKNESSRKKESETSRTKDSSVSSGSSGETEKNDEDSKDERDEEDDADEDNGGSSKDEEDTKDEE